MPQQPHIRIALCQEGRTDTRSLHWEGEYFKALFSGRYGVAGQHLGGPHVTVECYEFRFDDARNLQQDRLPTTDIFYMTGFTGKMAPALRRVMQEQCERGEDADDEGCPWDLEQRSVEQQLYSQIKARVQYNKMVYMGSCGGACCFGRNYWSGWSFKCNLTLFDFCMGVSLRYDSGSPPGLCDQSHISSRIFMITSGAGLAVHIENHGARASSFPCARNTHWHDWCLRAGKKHQLLVEEIAQRQTGPFYDPSVGTWHFNCDGTYWVSAPPLPSPP